MIKKYNLSELMKVVNFYGPNGKIKKNEKNEASQDEERKPVTLSRNNSKLVSSEDVIRFMEQAASNDMVIKSVNVVSKNTISEGTNYSRLFNFENLKDYGLTDDEIQKYFKHNTETRYSLEDNSPIETDDYSLISKTINGVEYKTEEDAINAIINARNGFINLTGVSKEDAIMHTSPNLDRTAYSKQDLLNLGLKDEIEIGKYFESVTKDIAKAQKANLRLKPGLKAEGKSINTVTELIDAINSGKTIIDETKNALKNRNSKQYFKR